MPLNFGHAAGHANARIHRSRNVSGLLKGEEQDSDWRQERDSSTLFSEHLKVTFSFQAAIFGLGKLVFQQALRFIRICVLFLFGKLSLFSFSSVQAQLRGHWVADSRERQRSGLFGS